MIPRSAPPVPRHVRRETHVHPVNADFYHVHSMNVNWDLRGLAAISGVAGNPSLAFYCPLSRKRGG